MLWFAAGTWLFLAVVLTVATQGLAVLGATLAARYGAAWLLIPAVAALILGLALYIVTSRVSTCASC